MKKTKPSLGNNELSHILKQLTKRIEEAATDIHAMTRGIKSMSHRLGTVEGRLDTLTDNYVAIGVDMRKMREDTDDLIGMSREILAKMVTQKEFESLSQRVAALEN